MDAERVARYGVRHASHVPRVRASSRACHVRTDSESTLVTIGEEKEMVFELWVFLVTMTVVSLTAGHRMIWTNTLVDFTPTHTILAHL